MKYSSDVFTVILLCLLAFMSYQYYQRTETYKLYTKIYELQVTQDELEFNHNNCLRQRLNNGDDTDICYSILFAKEEV